jgi:hypothetical protein
MGHATSEQEIDLRPAAGETGMDVAHNQLHRRTGSFQPGPLSAFSQSYIRISRSSFT